MTPEKQRVAIAELCGWKFAGRINDKLLMWPPIHGDWRHPPDYLNDLNAMFDAEKFLTDSEVEQYDIILSSFFWSGYPASRKNWHATAAQRAEAFLRAKDLWID